MQEKVVMPKLGESVTEGTIIHWLKQPGDSVSQFEPLCEVSTDKVTAEVPSTLSGTVTEITATEGETVSVGDTICLIEVASPDTDTDTKNNTPPEQDVVQSNGLTRALLNGRYSPAVRRLAREHDIDLNAVNGTGRGGRITRKDVLSYIEQQKNNNVSQLEETTDTQLVEPDDVTKILDREVSLTFIRRTIAERMLKSVRDVPHAWTMVEVDVTNLVRLRERIKQSFYEKERFRLTYLPFFIDATVKALKKFPRMNAVFAGDKIIEKQEINISIAVAAHDALYVPVIHRADQLNILGIARRLENIVEKTKKNRLTLEDTTGGTFTINNTGAFGSIVSKPIINMPQTGVVTLEKIVKRPVVIGEAIAIRDMVNVCLSFDHRVLDGWTAGQFLQCLKDNLESFREEDTVY